MFSLFHANNTCKDISLTSVYPQTYYGLEAQVTFSKILSQEMLGLLSESYEDLTELVLRILQWNKKGTEASLDTVEIKLGFLKMYVWLQ